MQPFIDLGWHTVPLQGELKRLEGGKKTLPKFEEDWRKTYQEKYNTKATSIGGVITGEVSGIVAIDCDNSVTWELFRSLDPNYKALFISQGKGENCGTIIYRYSVDCCNSFSINDGTLALDFYGNKGFVYLPTESNTTKLPWEDATVDISPMPNVVAVLINQLRKSLNPVQEQVKTNLNIMTASCLAPLVKQFCLAKSILPGLFKIITPRDFRDMPEYLTNGYLHPDEVPQGRGSEYLSKVSAILGADISIDEELYAEAMHRINDLFSEPMIKNNLDKTILDPMLSGRASINGKSIWQYDKEWEKFRLVLSSKRQSSLELCFDDIRNIYYVVDLANETVKQFGRDSELMAYIEATATSAPKKVEVKRSIPIVNVRTKPHKAFGFCESDDPTARILNTFKQTPEMAVLTNPSLYAEKYREPKTILNFFASLIPEEKMRNFVLSFMKRKLTTFDYSPVVLYFLGVPGSGKDTFVRIFETMLGHVARPTTREFLEMFNGWLLDTFLVQLDEYGDQLTKLADKQEALGKLKLYSGKQNVQIRQMRTDGFMYHHNATFIMTANKNPLMLEDGDRRVALLATPNVLMEQKWIQDSGGVSAMQDRIDREIIDFAYYLATEVPDLSRDEYMKPPESEDKQRLIADSMYAAQKIAYCLKHGMKEYLLDLCEEFEATTTAKHIKSGNLYTDDLEDLYAPMTNFNGDMRSLNKVLRSTGLGITPSTREGKKAYKIILPWTVGEWE